MPVDTRSSTSRTFVPGRSNGEAHLSLAARQPLGAIDDDRSRRMRAGHTVRQDQRSGTGGEDDIDRPLREVLGDDSAEALGE